MFPTLPTTLRNRRQSVVGDTRSPRRNLSVLSLQLEVSPRPPSWSTRPVYQQRRDGREAHGMTGVGFLPLCLETLGLSRPLLGDKTLLRPSPRRSHRPQFLPPSSSLSGTGDVLPSSTGGPTTSYVSVSTPRAPYGLRPRVEGSGSG